MNHQEQFDTICIHLAKQEKQAMDNLNNCEYLTKNGLKCAIGCLLTEDELKIWTTSNTNSVEMNIKKFGNPKNFKSKDADLLIEMQTAHDFSTQIETLIHKLIKIAYNFKLNNKKVYLIKKWN